MTRMKLAAITAVLAMLVSPGALAADQAVKRTPPRGGPATSGQATPQRRAPSREQAPPRTRAPRPSAQATPRTAVPRTPGRRAVIVPYFHYRPYVYVEPGFTLGFYYGVPFYYPDYRFYGFQGYGYPMPDPYYGWGASGSVRLDIPQKDAQVFVDGYFVGVVDDFDSAYSRLELTVGPHRIEVKAPGYESLTIDVFVQPDQTIRYRGALKPSQRSTGLPHSLQWYA